MNDKHYDFRNETGTYQTGRTQPPKHYRGLLAFLIVLVILLSGISTALSIMNMKLYWQLNRKQTSAPVAFSRSEEVPQATEAVHEEVRQLQSHLGISGTIIPDVYLRYYKLPRGIYVSQVAGSSEAQEKGLVAGDIITSLDGHAIHDNLMLDLWAAGLEEGDPIDLTIYRAGSEFILTLNWSNFD
jgi:S1-C subfamily serine protease